jgi:Cache domain
VSQAAGRGARLLADVTRRMEQVLSSVTGLVMAAESIAGEAGRTPCSKPLRSKPPCSKPLRSKPPCSKPLRRDDFAALKPLVARLLREHAGLAAGAGVVLAPATLADAPRCIEWWWADRSARVVPLEVDLDPESAEFYDYTTTEWYREPERTGAPTLAGPYVDFICTHEYTFTLAAPIRHAGRFIGVAAADILATQVERLVLPGLCGLGLSGPGQAAVLTSGHGRVIASTSASLPPGAALPRVAEAGFTPLAGPGAGQPPRLLPWSLLTVPTA